jgi:hypothetical protein
MSGWEAKKAERNRQSLARLNKALPRIFPSAVLAWALGHPFVPPTPRLAVDSYWRANPIRADRLARALANRSGAPRGWTWQLDDSHNHGLPATYRTPPAPYREHAYSQGPGSCSVCGQPVYRFGWHVDLWDIGANMNASWHCACVIAWKFWNAPSGYAASCGGCKPGAVVKAADGCGRAPKLITASRCFGCGASSGKGRGRVC